MDWDSESLTRMTLPIRSLSYSPSGLQLVAAGDDGIIKHVNVSSKSARDPKPGGVLKGPKGSCTRH
jgi:WD40 repeat protein